MLKRLTIAASLLSLLATPLLAQGRPDARQMTCGQVQSLLNERGAAVLTTGRHTYDRYVATGQFCSIGERAVRDWIATRDTDECRVNRCQIADNDGDWLFDRF